MNAFKDWFGDTPYHLPQPTPNGAFDGDTYKPELDYSRLNGQMALVFSLMRDGQWRTLAQIAEAVHGTEATVSARLRDFRKSKYGAHTVNRRYVKNGLFEYRLLLKGG